MVLATVCTACQFSMVHKNSKGERAYAAFQGCACKDIQSDCTDIVGAFLAPTDGSRGQRTLEGCGNGRSQT